MTININDEDYKVILADTAGQEEFDKLRRFAYKDVCNLFLMLVIPGNILECSLQYSRFTYYNSFRWFQAVYPQTVLFNILFHYRTYHIMKSCS